jgi:uncharacterized membrane protein
MAPLVILVVVTLAVLLARRLGRTLLPGPAVPLRIGLAAMFTATGLAHFIGMRAEMIRMVPPGLPAPGFLVTLTGALELAAVIGLLIPRTARWTAIGLTVQLVAMFPANVHAALAHLSSAPEDQLLPRTLMQLVFLAATVAVAAQRTTTTAGKTPAPQQISSSTTR